MKSALIVAVTVGAALAIASAACSSSSSGTTTGGDGGASSSSGGSSSGGSSGGGGGGTCDAKSKCPNEEAPDAEEKAECQKEVDGPCGSDYSALVSCIVANEKCDADGKSDVEGTLPSCKTEFDAYAKCKQSNAGDGG